MRKYIAPIIIVSLILIWLAINGIVLLFIPIGGGVEALIIRILVIIGVPALMAPFIAILIERIKEIKEDEKDDLGKY